jgi:hypothetical protein
MGMVMIVTVIVEVLMVMRMCMVMGMAVGMLMGMSLPIMGVLVGMGVAMLMGMSTGCHIVGNMHIYYSFIWYPLKGVADSDKIEYNRRKSPERRKLLCLISTIITTTPTYMPMALPIPTVTFTKTRRQWSTDWHGPLDIWKK